MKHAVALLVCTVGLSGCLTSNVLVTVRPDGSGTVEQTTIIRPSGVAAFGRLVSPDLAPKPQDSAALSKALRGLGAESILGRNLQVRTARPVSGADSTGWIITYDFADVGETDLDVMPRVPGMRGFYGFAAQGPASTRLKATLEPIEDGLQRLSMRFPQFALDASGEPPAEWASGSASEMGALRNVMKGSRVTLAVKFEAPIVRTNSPFRQDNIVTLLDVDVEEALFSKQIGMLGVTPVTFDELLTAFADLPGVTLAHHHTVTVDFQNPSATPQSPPAQGPPDTDIFLASLAGTNGKLSIGTPTNISNNQGYDNQPSFTPDGQAILFSSARGAAAVTRSAPASPSALSQTDIYRYDIAARRVSRVTTTPEGEYSPTVMPDGSHISVVRVEADGTQRLWRLSGNGVEAESSVILAEIKPVGYHAWINDRTVALYVLGDRGQPATLQVGDTMTGKAALIATNIGRSIQRMPSGAISFVQRESAAGDGPPPAMITQLLNATASPRGSIGTAPLIRPAAGAADPFLAWTPDGTLLMAVNSTVYRWRAGEVDWTVVANLEPFGLRDVSRLAVAPNGDRLAIVAQRK